MGSQNYTGTVTWNANGTIQTLATVDGITGGNVNTTVTYGYDDLGRLHTASDGVNLSQTYTYDQYGNITTGGSPFAWNNQTYVASTNRYLTSGSCGSGIQYDSVGDGNLLCDTFHTYTWDSGDQLLSVDGHAILRDGLGRVVESNGLEILYSPIGKLGFVTGQTMTKIRIPLPGGGQAIYNGGVLAKFNHPDWQGNIRVGSYAASRTLNGVSEYTPFGMPYDNGTVGPAGPSFNGSYGDVLDSHEYDSATRELHPVQGRWIQPDPAGLAAVDPSNPQTWNRYAYVANNPLSFIDPAGLELMRPGVCDASLMDCGGGAGLAGGAFAVYSTGPGGEGSVFTGWIVFGGGGQTGEGGPVGGGSGTCYYVLLNPCGVPANPCSQAGSAPNPSSYVAQVQQAGNQFPGSPFNSANNLMNQVNQFTTLFNFQRGGSLDAQPLGGSRAYGNYVFGAALSGAGYSLRFTLSAANTYAFISGAKYPGQVMDSQYGSIPAANVANITNGYNAQRNGSLCHK